MSKEDEDDVMTEARCWLDPKRKAHSLQKLEKEGKGFPLTASIGTSPVNILT